MKGAREPWEALELRVERSVWVWLYLCGDPAITEALVLLTVPREENNTHPALRRSETQMQNGSERGCQEGKLQAKSGSGWWEAMPGQSNPSL